MTSQKQQSRTDRAVQEERARMIQEGRTKADRAAAAAAQEQIRQQEVQRKQVDRNQKQEAVHKSPQIQGERGQRTGGRGDHNVKEYYRHANSMNDSHFRDPMSEAKGRAYQEVFQKESQAMQRYKAHSAALSDKVQVQIDSQGQNKTLCQTR